MECCHANLARSCKYTSEFPEKPLQVSGKASILNVGRALLPLQRRLKKN
jgi:hypothetical protein